MQTDMALNPAMVAAIESGSGYADNAVDMTVTSIAVPMAPAAWRRVVLTALP